MNLALQRALWRRDHPPVRIRCEDAACPQRHECRRWRARTNVSTATFRRTAGPCLSFSPQFTPA